jgi:molybdenum cofactor cytidylyltransferase
MIDGIVLAGGYSSRFFSNKMTVDLQGKPIIVHTIETMHQICDNIYVITGYYHQELTKLLKDFSFIEIIYNKNYNQGMFSSVKVGVEQVSHDFFIIPGDCPLVKESVYLALLKGRSNIRVPSYNRKLGHPLFMKYILKEDITNTSFTNLKDFRNNYNYEIVNVDDEGVLLDIDTVSDLNKIKGKE